MERFHRAMELENLSPISLKILDIPKMTCNRLHQMTDDHQDNAWRADLRLSFHLFCWIQEICKQMAVRNLQVHNLEIKDLLRLQILM